MAFLLVDQTIVHPIQSIRLPHDVGRVRSLVNPKSGCSPVKTLITCVVLALRFLK